MRRYEAITGTYEMYLLEENYDGHGVEFEFSRCEEGFVEFENLRFQETQRPHIPSQETCERIEEYILEL